MLLLALACSGDADPPGTDNGGDSTPGEETGFSWPDETNGTRPDDPLPVLADFSATNRDGGSRGPDDLVGGPTVIWFFPFADTPG